MPTWATLLATFAPMLLGFLTHQKEKDPTATFNKILQTLEPQLQPAHLASLKLAMEHGANLSQQYNDMAGSTGADQTGMGQVGQQLAAGAAGHEAAQANMQFHTNLVNLASNLMPNFLNPGMKPPSTLGNFVGAVGGASLNGQNPFMDLLKLFPKKINTQAGGANDIGQTLQTVF